MKRTLCLAVVQLALPLVIAGPAWASDVESTVLQFGSLSNSGSTPAGGVVVNTAMDGDSKIVSGFLQAGGRYGFGGAFSVPVSNLPDINYDWLASTAVSGEEPDIVSISSVTNNAASPSLYYVLSTGGTYHNGQILEYTPSTTGALYTFAGNTDGNKPKGALLPAGGGVEYVTAAYGGTGYGVVDQVMNGSVSPVHTFSFTDGAYPSGSLASVNRVTYGTTTGGGAFGFGTVYALDSKNTFTLLYSFKGGADGATPTGGLIADSAGNLYGTTTYGGTGTGQGNGTVFEITTNGTKTILYNMDGHTGTHPTGSLVLSPAGDLYGTTDQLGAKPVAGEVFKVTAAGVGSAVHRFATTDGYGPLPQISSAVLVGVFTIFGATSSGGTNDAGVVFKVTVSQ